jgi:hypothetical protein
MGKKTAHTPKLRKKFYPMVSVCTPTFNRRPFIQTMFQCFRNQTYPKDRMEWIIVDDGTDKIEDLIQSANIPQIKYFKQDRKMHLGEKRNYMHKHAKGSIIVYMDDDDYYPPERVEHAVDRLTENREALCAGASEIYIYYKHLQKMYQCGPYGPNHATAGTFAFRVELLKQTKYDDFAALAEEKAFLKDYTVPFVQLDPLKSILVFSHIHNTFDKRKLLDSGQHPDFFKESTKTIDQFIRLPNEAPIKQFFMTEIDELLNNYKPGNPEMKPDVIKQMKEIEIEREKIIKEHQQQNGGGQGKLMMHREGQPPVALTNEQIVHLITDQQNKIKEYEMQLQNQSVGQPTLNIMMNREGHPPTCLTKEQIIQIMTDQQKKINEQSEVIQKLQMELSAMYTQMAK